MARILLIEPDTLFAQSSRRALESAGHIVQTAATAQGGIHAADAERPDVVVLELQLVAHSGIEFLYEFRSYVDWLEVPIIIHTNVPASEFAGSRALLRNELGVCAYLYKPQTSLRQLLRSVNELVAV